MNELLIGAIASLPWIVVPIATVIRLRRSRSLDEESDVAPDPAPPVSVVIPARNEARTIERCIRSVLTTTYPNLEVIVVDDESTDGTGVIARRISDQDERVRVISTAPRPDDWIGKQWACQTGASGSTGEIICFADADTVHFADLISRSVNALERRGADLFSVLGRQELGSFWEKLIQPQIFGMMAVRYGGTESVNNSPRASDKIANGQCLFVRRSTYEEFGGHSIVRSHVADDLMLAQRYFARGKSVILVLGLNQLKTRMYTSLGEIKKGWKKNVFAGGRTSAIGGAVGRFFYAPMLLSAPLSGFLPHVILALSLLGVLPPGLIAWSAITSAALLIWWLYAYSQIGESPLYAFISPIGALTVFYIFLAATVGGQNVEWKGRHYRAER